MSYYIPLPCCECTASTNPCDSPCLVSAVATISGSIGISASGLGDRNVGEFPGGKILLSPVPYSYTIDFSLTDEISLDSYGNGQTTSVDALFDQRLAYSAGANCGGSPCEGSKVINGQVTTGLGCPVNLCDGGQIYQLGTNLGNIQSNSQFSNCAYPDPPPNEDENDHEVGYYCYETNSLDPTAGVVLSYLPCTTNGFDISFSIVDGSILYISTTQNAQYVSVGQIFIDNLAPRPLYAGYAGIEGDTSLSINGSMNVVIDRVIGYINENNQCVAPP